MNQQLPMSVRDKLKKSKVALAFLCGHRDSPPGKIQPFSAAIAKRRGRLGQCPAANALPGSRYPIPSSLSWAGAGGPDVHKWARLPGALAGVTRLRAHSLSRQCLVNPIAMRFSAGLPHTGIFQLFCRTFGAFASLVAARANKSFQRTVSQLRCLTAAELVRWGSLCQVE